VPAHLLQPLPAAGEHGAKQCLPAISSSNLAGRMLRGQWLDSVLLRKIDTVASHGPAAVQLARFTPLMTFNSRRSISG